MAIHYDGLQSATNMITRKMFANLVTGFMSWIQRFWLSIIILSFFMVFVSWMIGYYANALYGMRFDLASCWQGLGTIGGAGFIAGIKYLIDSSMNSAKAEMPKMYITSETYNEKEEQVNPRK